MEISQRLISRREVLRQVPQVIFLTHAAVTGEGLDSFTKNVTGSPTASISTAEMVIPLLDPRYAYAAARHLGETRVGSMGTVNKYPAQSRAEVRRVPGGLRFRFAFRQSTDQEEFVGVWFSLGRIGISTTNPDCTRGPDLELHRDSTWNFDDLMPNASDNRISISALRLVLRPDGRDQTLTLRVEVEDRNRQKLFMRLPFDSRSTTPVTLTLPLAAFTGTINRTAVKLVAIVIEERHVVDDVVNPPTGGFDIYFVGFVATNSPPLSAAFIASLDDRKMIAELAQRDFESLMRLVDSKTGALLDRTLTRDLIHYGSTGWLMASLPAAVRQGWITPQHAYARALKILRFLDQDSLWGDNPVGKVGNSRGLLYRFGGIDPHRLHGPLTGTRKLDVGNCNAVEASVIDTALFHMGAATMAAGFTSSEPPEKAIRQRVRRLLNRTYWDELVDPVSGQFYLSWKPEQDNTPLDYFVSPADFGGYWASRDPATLEPLTADYYSDEWLIAAILAAGSETHPISAGPWYNMQRLFGTGVGQDVIVTWPGAWFTYTFLTATYLHPRLGADQGAAWNTVSVDWTRNAIRAFQAYQTLSPVGQLILPDAVELPDTTYSAQALPALAVNANALFTGTQTPYSLQLAIGLGAQTASHAIAALRRLLLNRPEQWDPIFGLLDSFHPDLAAFPQPAGLIRTTGRWVQQQVWPLNKGGALLAQLNYLDDGIIWRTANRHPVVRRGIDRIYRQPRRS